MIAKGYIVQLMKLDTQGWYTISYTRYKTKSQANKIALQYSGLKNFKAVVKQL